VDRCAARRGRGGTATKRTRANYPGPPTDALGKIIRFCGGAGSRTWVRYCRGDVGAI